MPRHGQKTRKYEQRAFDIELREAAGQPTQIIGYAAVFNSLSFGEIIRPGAFKKTIEEGQDVKAFWGHNADLVLGRRGNGTLDLREDGKGLFVEILPNPDTEWGRSALASVARKDVTQMSFGFETIQASEETIDGENVRVLKELRLFEVSPVALPWYEDTTAEARNEPEPVQAGHSTMSAEARKRCLELMQLRTITI